MVAVVGAAPRQPRTPLTPLTPQAQPTVASNKPKTGFMGVLMCEACAATTPELPPSAFRAAVYAKHDRIPPATLLGWNQAT